MPHLPNAGSQTSPRSMLSCLRPKKIAKSIMKSYSINTRKYEYLPIRIRPWFIAFSCFVMIALAFLGFTDFSHSLPLNDKLLHFLCLGLATGVLYWVFDVEEDARRIWIWRHSGLIITGVICLFFGGIVSEIVQSLLPYKEFQLGDVLANLTGSSIGLIVSYHLERYYRHRREINRLYRPLAGLSDTSDSEDEMPLPTYRQQNGHKPTSSQGTGDIRLGNIWDETDDALRNHEIFAIGDDDELNSARLTPNTGRLVSKNVDRGPKIVITAPSTASINNGQ